MTCIIRTHTPEKYQRQVPVRVKWGLNNLCTKCTRNYNMILVSGGGNHTYSHYKNEN